MKIGLVGYGSIGKRHTENLLTLGYRNITLFRTSGKGNDHNLKEIYDFQEFTKEHFDFVIISNPSTKHFQTALPFLRSDTNLLIEKPLVFTEEEEVALESLVERYKGIGMVALNMRFHPCMTRLKEILSSGLLGKAYSARFSVGQYLPDWRPGKDYSTGVSALKKLGGGVVLELIHEIDMAIYLFGSPSSEISSIALKTSDLEIETEDISEILWKSESNTIISVHQNYLSRSYRREIEIIGAEGTIFCDLKASTIRIIGINGAIMAEETIPFERNDMYLSLMKYFAGCVKEGQHAHPDLSESLDSVRVALKVKETNQL